MKEHSSIQTNPSKKNENSLKEIPKTISSEEASYHEAVLQQYDVASAQKYPIVFPEEIVSSFSTKTSPQVEALLPGKNTHFDKTKNHFAFLLNASLFFLWVLGGLGLMQIGQRAKREDQINRQNTEQLQNEKEMISLDRDRLEKLIEERTRELQQALEASRKAEEDAARASAAKSLFLAHMTHEIRTPLNGVIGLSQLLSQSPLSPKQAEFLKLIHLSGETLLSLVNDILDFSKIEAGKFELSYNDFHLIEKLQSVLGILSTRSQSNRLELCLDVDPKIPRIVYGDAPRLLQIILNFSGNAVKFTEQGGVRISVALAEKKEDSIQVRFRICDTGIGVPEEKLHRLFQVYSQTDVSVSEKYGGTGLGLVIANNLVEMMGGKVSVESEVGVGTSFSFTIPFGYPIRDEEKSEKLYDSLCRSCDFFPSLEGFPVLIVDDNEILCESLTTQLEFWKMQPILARNRYEAMARLLNKKADELPKLLIVDQEFGGCGAAEFLNEIQQDPVLEAIPVICLQALTSVTSPTFQSSGNISIVKKPISVSELFNTILTSLFGEKLDVYLKKREERDRRHSFISNQKREHRILVAEDNKVNQIVITEILKNNGYECDVVPNGLEAVEAALSGRYSLVFMDCQMPEMDGFEATKIIREKEKQAEKKRLPIIALTANATKDDRQLCMDVGMDAYCCKPINPGALFKELNSFLDETE